MKTVTLLSFLCAFLALNQASAVLPEAEEGNLEDTRIIEPEDEGNFTDAGNNQLMTKLFCSAGWSHFKGRCYRYFSSERTWIEAEKHCLSIQANLVSIHSSQEHSYVYYLIQSSGHVNGHVWIGGTDLHQNNVWLWSDGNNFLDVNWCARQPDCGNRRNCAVMNYGRYGCWGTWICNAPLTYVCVKRTC